MVSVALGTIFQIWSGAFILSSVVAKHQEINSRIKNMGYFIGCTIRYSTQWSYFRYESDEQIINKTRSILKKR